MDDWRNFVGLLPEGLIIAFSTLLLYTIAFFYLVGFVGFFGIPYQFVDLGLAGIIEGGFFVVVLELLSLAVSSMIVVILNKYSKPSVVKGEYNPWLNFFVMVMIGCLVFVVIGAVFPMRLGRIQASNKIDFLVTSTYPEMVVLYKGGDNLICAPFDRKEKKVYRRFTILRLDKDSVPVLSLQKVGPLSVEE